MGKNIIKKYLRTNRKFLTVKQVSQGVSKTVQTTNRILNTMVRWGEAEKKMKKIKVGKIKKNVSFFRIKK